MLHVLWQYSMWTMYIYVWSVVLLHHRENNSNGTLCCAMVYTNAFTANAELRHALRYDDSVRQIGTNPTPIFSPSHSQSVWIFAVSNFFIFMEKNVEGKNRIYRNCWRNCTKTNLFCCSPIAVLCTSAWVEWWAKKHASFLTFKDVCRENAFEAEEHFGDQRNDYFPRCATWNEPLTLTIF